MGIKRHVEISPLVCIHPTNGLEICPIQSNSEHPTQAIETPILSHETTLVTIAPGTIEDLFVHHYQTDQLLAIQGKAVLVILQNRRYDYILMSAHQLRVVKIPPGIPHGAINLNSEPCIAINSIIRHGAAHAIDYRPLRKPFPFDLARVKELLNN